MKTITLYTTFLLILSMFIFSISVSAENGSQQVFLELDNNQGSVQVDFLFAGDYIEDSKEGVSLRLGNPNISNVIDLNLYKDIELRIILSDIKLKKQYRLKVIDSSTPKNIKGFKKVKNSSTSIIFKKGEDKKTIYYKFLEENLNKKNLPSKLNLTFQIEKKNKNEWKQVGEDYSVSSKPYQIIPKKNIVAQKEIEENEQEDIMGAAIELPNKQEEEGIKELPNNKEEDSTQATISDLADTSPNSNTKESKLIAYNNTTNATEKLSKKPKIEQEIVKKKIKSAAELAWEKALKKPTIEVYRNFIVDYPNNNKVDEAKKQHDILLLNEFESNRNNYIFEIGFPHSFYNSPNIQLEGNEENKVQYDWIIPNQKLQIQVPYESVHTLSFQIFDNSSKPILLDTKISPLTANMKVENGRLYINNIVGGKPPYRLDFINEKREYIVASTSDFEDINKEISLSSINFEESGTYTIRLTDQTASQSILHRGVFIEISNKFPWIWLLLLLIASVIGVVFYYHKKQQKIDADNKYLQNQQKISEKEIPALNKEFKKDDLFEEEALENSNILQKNIQTPIVSHSDLTNEQPVVGSKRRPSEDLRKSYNDDSDIAIADKEKQEIKISRSISASPKRRITVKRRNTNKQKVTSITNPTSDKSYYFEIPLNEMWENTSISKVFLHQRCAVRIDNFVFDEDMLRKSRDEDIPEIGGFLLGTYQFQEESKQYEVYLERFGEIRKPNNDKVYQIAFGPKEWELLDELKDIYKDDGLVLIGWFHTHPGHGLFLSRPDLRIHNHFKEPYQLAMEMDSVRSEDNNPNYDVGFFSRTKDGIGINNSKDLKGSWVGWNKVQNWIKNKRIG